MVQVATRRFWGQLVKAADGVMAAACLGQGYRPARCCCLWRSAWRAGGAWAAFCLRELYVMPEPVIPVRVDVVEAPFWHLLLDQTGLHY